MVNRSPLSGDRIASLDFLRLTCSFFVVAIHVFMDCRVQNGEAVYSVIFAESFTRVCVPIFFMLTGYFMFRRKKTSAEVVKYVVLRLIVPTLITGLLLVLLEPFLSGSASFADCFSSDGPALIAATVKDLLALKPPRVFFYLWFAISMPVIYLLYPLFKLICSDAKWALAARLAVMVVFFSLFFIFPALLVLRPELWPVRFNFDIPFYAVFYILVGYSLYRMFDLDGLRFSRRSIAFAALVLYIISSLATFFSTKYLDILYDGEFNHTFFYYYRVPIAAAAFGFMSFFLCINIKNVLLRRVFSYLGNRTFTLYLVHYPVIMLLTSRGLHKYLIRLLPGFIATFLFIFICFGFSLIIAMLIDFAVAKSKALFFAKKTSGKTE